VLPLSEEIDVKKLFAATGLVVCMIGASSILPIESSIAQVAAPALPVSIHSEEALNTAGLFVDVTDIARKNGMLTVKLRFRNTSRQPQSVQVTGSDWYLVSDSTKYLMLQDSGYQNVWSGCCYTIAPGSSQVFWGRWPAPIADVKALTLYSPLTAPMDDLPISDR
jgi:hypothetical protein